MLEADAITRLGDLAAAGHARMFDTPDGGQAVALPTGYGLHKLPPVDPLLTHVKQRVVLHDRDSFVAYVNAYKRPVSRIFAEPGFLSPTHMPAISAVLDYHDAGAADGDQPPVPKRVAHLAVYSPRYSEAWTRWTAICAGPIRQVEFAEFIEECREDIRTPSAAELLDVVRTFKAAKKVHYDSVVYQSNGSVKLEYSDAVEKVGKSLSLPEQMTLGIPVYYRGEPFAIGVFIRFKLGEGGVAFSLKIDRADRFEDEAFNGLASDVAQKTGVPVHIGRI